jgi:hypothetical protein
MSKAGHVVDGVFEHGQLKDHYIVKKNVMNLYIETMKLLVSQRRQMTN